jgi:PAS domain S-box-containing protein
MRVAAADVDALIDAFRDAVLIVDVRGAVRMVNAAAGRLYGVPPGELVGRDLVSLMPARFRAAHVAGFTRYVTTGTSRLVGGPPFRGAALRADGTEIDVEVTLGAVGEPGEPGFLVVATVRDVAVPADSDSSADLARYLGAIGDVAARLQVADDLDAAYAAILPTLGGRLDWDVATLWTLRPGGDRVMCVGVWRSDRLPDSALEVASRGLTLRQGACLPGASWARGEPIATPVDSAALRLSRKTAARADGLRQALAFPLTGARGPVGFVELFRADPNPVSRGLVEVVRTIGRQVGQYVARVRVEQDLRYRSALLASQLDLAGDAVLAVSPDRRVLAVNRRFAELWRLPPDRFGVGAEAPDVFAACRERALDRAAFDAGVAWSADDPTRTAQFSVPLRDGRVVDGYAVPIRGPAGEPLGRVWHLRDDTERRKVDAQRAELETRLRTAERRQDFLLRASDVLAGAASYDETLERLAEVAVPTLGDLCLIDVLDESGRLVRMAARHADPDRQPLVEELRQRYAPDPQGRHPAVAAIVSRQTEWSPDMSDDFLRATTRDDHHFDVVKALDFTSYVSVPLVADDQVLGSVTLVSAGSGRRFGPADVAIVEQLAGRVALVVAKARRYDREHRTSHALQATLLPSAVPTVPGLTIAVRYLPGTRNVDVGGDFYDVIALASGEVAITVGDVAGHDVTAAATMGQLRSASRALIGHATGPAGLIELLHGSWDALGLDRIATVVYLGLRPDDGALRMASAGHLPPLVLENGRASYVELDPGGPLGAPETPATDWFGTLGPGGVLMCYTDGLVESRERDIDVGLDRLLTAVERAGTTEPDELCDRVVTAMAGAVRGDDVALLVVRRDAG